MPVFGIGDISEIKPYKPAMMPAHLLTLIWVALYGKIPRVVII